MSNSTERIGVIDALRVLALLLLLVGHYVLMITSSDGRAPVSLPVEFSIVVFFVLTGFLATRSLCSEWDARGEIRIPRFWLRRLARLLPTMLALVTLTTLHQLAKGEGVPPARVVTFLGFVGNYYYALAESDDLRYALGHMWFIAVSTQFLALLPFAVRWALATGRDRVLMLGLGIVATASAILRTATLWMTEAEQVYVYNATQHRIDELTIGSLLAFVVRDERLAEAARQQVARTRTLILASVALIVSLAASPTYRFGPGFTIEALLTALLLLGTMGAAGGREWGWMKAAPLRLLSRVTLSVYTWHLMAFVFDRFAVGLPLVVRVVLLLALSVTGGWFAYHLLEQPGVRLARRFTLRLGATGA